MHISLNLTLELTLVFGTYLNFYPLDPTFPFDMSLPLDPKAENIYHLCKIGFLHYFIAGGYNMLPYIYIYIYYTL